MNIAAIITIITSISKAIPIVDKWIEQIIAAYIVQRKAWIIKENHEAIKLAINNHDQRDLEDTAHSGEYSGVGTIRDSLPGVKK